MAFPAQFLNASDAAQRLGVSAKALRLYEERGLLSPVRTAAGWRTYGPEQLRIAGEIAALRGLGFSLGQVARVLQGKPDGLEPALAAHQTVLEGRVQHLAGTIDRVRGLRDSLARGEAPSVGQLATLMAPDAAPPGIAFDLPWPWGGERFELQRLQPLTYIIGPLGSGKTRLAQRLAETIPRRRLPRPRPPRRRQRERAARRRASAAGPRRSNAHLAARRRRHGVGRPARPADRPRSRNAGRARRRYDRTGARPVHPAGADRPSAPPRSRRSQAVRAHPLERHPRPRRDGARRDNHLLPRQPQPAELCGALPRRRRLRSRRHLPRLAGGAGPARPASSPGGRKWREAWQRYFSGPVRNSVTRSPPCIAGGPGGLNGRPVALASAASVVTIPTRQPLKRLRSTWPSAV